jgi:hypothetical protein
MKMIESDKKRPPKDFKTLQNKIVLYIQKHHEGQLLRFNEISIIERYLLEYRDWQAGIKLYFIKKFKNTQKIELKRAPLMLKLKDTEIDTREYYSLRLQQLQLNAELLETKVTDIELNSLIEKAKTNLSKIYPSEDINYLEKSLKSVKTWQENLHKEDIKGTMVISSVEAGVNQPITTNVMREFCKTAIKIYDWESKAKLIISKYGESQEDSSKNLSKNQLDKLKSDAEELKIDQDLLEELNEIDEN